MTDQSDLAAEPRESIGRGHARAARRAGRVPAVVYGGKEPPVTITVDERTLVREYDKGGFANRLLDLKVGGDTYRVLPREIQLHPVSDRLLHVDFLRLTAESQIRISVPAVFINDEESPGLKRGGVLNVVRYEIELMCRADSIPEQIVCDLTGLDIGDGVHIEDVDLPEGVNPTIADRNFTIATVAAPTIHVEEEVEGEEEELLEGEEGEVAEGEEGDEGAPAEGAEEKKEE
jgi:large subunit ribosomal protein L25